MKAAFAPKEPGILAISILLDKLTEVFFPTLGPKSACHFLMGSPLTVLFSLNRVRTHTEVNIHREHIVS